MPSRVRAGAQSCRARVAQTQCSPTVFVIFLSAMAEASLTAPMCAIGADQHWSGQMVACRAGDLSL
jgi:hypothetical protein